MLTALALLSLLLFLCPVLGVLAIMLVLDKIPAIFRALMVWLGYRHESVANRPVDWVQLFPGGDCGA